MCPPVRLHLPLFVQRPSHTRPLTRQPLSHSGPPTDRPCQPGQPATLASTHLHVFQQLLPQGGVVLLPRPLAPLHTTQQCQQRVSDGAWAGCWTCEAGKKAGRQAAMQADQPASMQQARQQQAWLACMRMRHCRRKWRRNVASRSCRPIRRLELRYLTLAPWPSPAPAQGRQRGVGSGSGGEATWPRCRSEVEGGGCRARQLGTTTTTAQSCIQSKEPTRLAP